MRELLNTVQSSWRRGIVAMLFTLAALPTHGQELPDDILVLSRQMVERERARDYASALVLGQKALRIAEETMGPETVEVAIYSDYVGMVHLKASHERAAEKHLLRALAIRENVLGAKHVAVASTLRHLAETYRRLGEAEQAVTLLRRALAIDERAFGVQDMSLVTTLESIGLIYLNEGRYADGEPVLLRALAIQDHAGRTDDLRTARTLEYYARLLRETGRPNAAIEAETRIKRLRSSGKK